MIRYIELVRYKIFANLKAEAARGGLGILWWVIDPTLYMFTFYIVFQFILSRGGNGYVNFLITGLIIWKWFASSVSMGSMSIRNGAGLMQRTHVPKIFFPLVDVLTNTVKFLIVFLLLIIFLLLMKIPITIAWTTLPILLFTQLVFILFIAGMCSVIMPFFIDFKLIVDNGLMLGLFLSGTFYDIQAKSGKIRYFLDLNPMARLIVEYRKVLIKGLFPDFKYLAILFFVSLIGFGIVYLITVRYNRIYPKIIC